MSELNLDRLAAQTAQDIVGVLVPTGATDAKKRAAALDNVATKALGVLQENGVYAGMLFLYVKSSDAFARGVRDSLLQSLAAREVSGLGLALPTGKDLNKWQDVGEHLTGKVCNDLDTLLLVKQVWEQTLIYVRYGAKARGEV